MTLSDTIKQWEHSGTDGPWKADLGEAFHIRESDRGSLAQMKLLKGRGGLGGRRDVNAVAATARLIAAAPDMVAAIKAAEEMADLLQEYRDKTPLGHQPHMIAEAADEALAAFRQHMNAEK